MIQATTPSVRKVRKRPAPSTVPYSELTAGDTWPDTGARHVAWGTYHYYTTTTTTDLVWSCSSLFAAMFRSNRIFPLPIDTPCQHRTPDHCADFPIKYQQTYNLYRVSQKKCCSCLSGLNSFSRMDNLDKILLFHHTIHLNHLCIKFQACLKSPFFIENYSCFFWNTL